MAAITPRTARLIAAAFLGLMTTAASAAALEVHVKQVASSAAAIHASIELRDVIPERFKRLLDTNGALHLRVQAELWENRPVWDRLVYPAIVRVIRLAPPLPPTSQMPMQLELGKNDRILASGRYYLHVIATIGTLAERDVDEVGDAVFGRPSEGNSLGSLGRLFFRTALQINDYMQSVSATARSRKMSGTDLLKALAP